MEQELTVGAGHRLPGAGQVAGVRPSRLRVKSRARGMRPSNAGHGPTAACVHSSPQRWMQGRCATLVAGVQPSSTTGVGGHGGLV
jgi:hypothetical protein